MGALLVESLPQKKTSIVTAVRVVVEVALLTSGLIYTILMIKGAVFPSSFDFVLSSFRKPVSFFSSWLNSPFYIYIFMNIIVILIAASSLFHHPKMDSNSDIEDGGGDSSHEDYDLQSALSPSLSPPPAPPQNNQKYHVPEGEPKDIEIAAPTAAATTAISTTKISSKGGKLTIARTSLENQQDITEDERVVEYHLQAVFSDFSRLAKAKEIKKAQTTIDGGKTRTAKQNTRDTHAAKVTDHHDSVQAIFADLPISGDTKEIREANLLDSSKQFKTIGNAMQDNQAKKHLENADGDEDNDTMEATWRAINGGTKPHEKQLQKSKTWPQAQKLRMDQEPEVNIELPVTSSDGAAVAKEMRKSMTFNDTASIARRGGLRRDPSVNLEEFNQRAEAFIQKFMDEMRLQRQESDQRYLDMINGGL